MGEIKSKIPRFKKPNWLRVKLPVGQEYKKVRNIVDKYKLHTICESGNLQFFLLNLWMIILHLILWKEFVSGLQI